MRKLWFFSFMTLMSVFYLIGFAVLGYGIWAAWRSTRAADWPTAPAEITYLELRARGGDDGPSYAVKVRYTYTVDRVDYEGSRLAFGYGGSGNREAHAEIHRKLKEAKAVAVRYNPSNPAVSCLSYGPHRSIQIVLAFAVVWLVFVFGLTALVWLFSGDEAMLIHNLSVW